MRTFLSDRHLSWGRVIRAQHEVAQPAWLSDVPQVLASPKDKPILAYGLGRSYGDSCLNPGGLLIDTSGMDRLITFDRESGVIRCESGISLGRVLEVSVPAGWFLPVSPGTKFVTVGGAVANDVHGKNHHVAGTFGMHVRALELYRSDGTRHLCTPTENVELFRATIGGLGLTGFIAWVEFQLEKIPSAMIVEDVIRFESLAEFFQLERESAAAFPFTVAWADCLATGPALGRGVFFRGRFAPAGGFRAHGGPRVAMPFDAPKLALSPMFMRLFNNAFYKRHTEKERTHTVHYDPFFYPLDTVGQWNRAYGKGGLYQYQFVLPDSEAGAFGDIMKFISLSGRGSFLAVLKRFGEAVSPGMMSFPMPGINLALDFANQGKSTLAFLLELDRRVVAAKGRAYPAKDGMMPGPSFRAFFPQWEAFSKYIDPRFSSLFWRRVTADLASTSRGIP